MKTREWLMVLGVVGATAGMAVSACSSDEDTNSTPRAGSGGASAGDSGSGDTGGAPGSGGSTPGSGGSQSSEAGTEAGPTVDAGPCPLAAPLSVGDKKCEECLITNCADSCATCVSTPLCVELATCIAKECPLTRGQAPDPKCYPDKCKDYMGGGVALAKFAEAAGQQSCQYLKCKEPCGF